MTVINTVNTQSGRFRDSSIFFRLIATDDKAATLANAVLAVGGGHSRGGVTFSIAPQALRRVPGTPFAYWASDSLRRKFQELPRFEGDGRTVKQGLATADDFRFVRAWWEVSPNRILDGANGPTEDIPRFQAWCRERTFQGKRWAPFAKGGEFSPYYSDLHLIVYWERDGAEMRSFGPSAIRNPNFYFRPGLTWPRRTNGLSFRSLPAGSVFGDKGPAAFAQHDDRNQLSVFASLLNSSMVYAFVQALVARVTLAITFEVGLIQSVPIPEVDEESKSALSQLANEAGRTRRLLAVSSEIDHTFMRPALAQVAGSSLVLRYS